MFILDKLKQLNLSTEKLVGHSYEGTHNINWVHKSLISRLKNDLCSATYVHYFANNLNTNLSNSCCIFTEVRNCLTTVNSLFNFIENSCKSKSLFKKMSKSLNETYMRLSDLNKKHWVSRKTAVFAARETYGTILGCLKVTLLI